VRRLGKGSEKYDFKVFFGGKFFIFTEQSTPDKIIDHQQRGLTNRDWTTLVSGSRSGCRASEGEITCGSPMFLVSRKIHVL